MQVEPIKPSLKALGTKRLKLKSDESPSNFAFKFNLRRFTKSVPVGAKTPRKPGLNPKATEAQAAADFAAITTPAAATAALTAAVAAAAAGARAGAGTYTRSHFSNAQLMNVHRITQLKS